MVTMLNPRQAKPHSEGVAVPNNFKSDDGQPLEFAPAPNLAQIGRWLIDECDEFEPLANFEITYLWKKEGGTPGGRPLLGKASKTSGEVRYFAESDFIIWLAADHCRAFGLSGEQFERVMFHQLMHCEIDLDGDVPKPKIRPHDVEMFIPELERYGPWTKELELLTNAAKQRTLPFAEPIPFRSRL